MRGYVYCLSDNEIPPRRASCWETFLSGNPNEKCNRYWTLLEEKQSGNDSRCYDDGNNAMTVKQFEYIFLTRSQHWNSFFDFKPLLMFELSETHDVDGSILYCGSIFFTMPAMILPNTVSC